MQAGGFSAITLDLCSVSQVALLRVPTSYWYRLQRAVENTSTVLAILSHQPQARACSSRQIDMTPGQPRWTGTRPFHFLDGVTYRAQQRKPYSIEHWPMAAAVGE